MLKTLLKKVEFINIIQKIQNDIAKATEMAVITVDYKGRPASKHSGCSEFCYSYYCKWLIFRGSYGRSNSYKRRRKE